MDYSEVFKKYGVYIVGAVGVLYLLTRSSGSSASSGVGDMLAYNAQASQLQQQANFQNAQLELANRTADREYSLQSKSLDIQGNVAQTQATAQMAAALGQTAGNVLDALYKPGISAMESAAYENAAVMQAAANTAVAGFESQADMLESSGIVISSVGDAVRGWEGVGYGVGNMWSGG